MNVFKTIIQVPEKIFFTGEVDSLVVPGLDGSFGVLADHVPLVAGVAGGVLKMVQNGEDEYLAVGRGTIHIENKTVEILVDFAIKATDEDSATELYTQYRESRATK